MDGSDEQAHLAIVGVDASWRGGIGRRDADRRELILSSDAESKEREEECEQHDCLHDCGGFLELESRSHSKNC